MYMKNFILDIKIRGAVLGIEETSNFNVVMVNGAYSIDERVPFD